AWTRGDPGATRVAARRLHHQHRSGPPRRRPDPRLPLATLLLGEEIPFDVVRRSIEHSLCFGLHAAGGQIGFARVVTDYAVFATRTSSTAGSASSRPTRPVQWSGSTPHRASIAAADGLSERPRCMA